MTKLKVLAAATIAGASMMVSATASADVCDDIGWKQFKAAAISAYDFTLSTGFHLGMWATLVNETGRVCYVYSVDGAAGADNGGKAAGNTAWLGSRVISIQKANTANAFSLNELAISGGALTVATYEGGSLFGLQASNPVDASRAYAGPASDYGKKADPAVGKRIGGLNVFGGAVALYSSDLDDDGNPVKIGAVGVSGDTSCRDHTMAYRLRLGLGFANEPNDDGLELIDTTTTPLSGLFQQPACGVSDPAPTVYQANGDNGIR